MALLVARMSVRGPLPKLMPVLGEALERRGCEVDFFPWGRRSENERMPAKLLGRTYDLIRARKALRRGRYPLVVVHTGHDWLTLTRDLALLRAVADGKRKVVLQFHGSQSPRLLAPGSRLFKRATAALLELADGVLVLSRGEQAEWQAFSPRSRVFVIRNPRPAIETSPPITEALVEIERPPTVLCVARLMSGKGVYELVRALPLVRRHVPCRLVLAGEGDEEPQVRALIAELGVEDFVELPGYVEGVELPRVYRSADVFALPTSLGEGFPTVILEAMEAGLPIVTTRLRGPADHLDEGRHALFVPPHDVEALANALVRLLTDADLRAKMGEENRERVRFFDADSVAEDYLAALKAIVEGAPAHGPRASRA